jgi:NAD+ diphosphatase
MPLTERDVRKRDDVVSCPFIPGLLRPESLEPESWWFAFSGGDLLVRVHDDGVDVPLATTTASLGVETGTSHFLGTLQGRACLATTVTPGQQLPSGFALQELRSLYGRVDEQLFAVAGRASQVLTWDRTHRFCGQCGTPTELSETERARKCPACGLTAYPRISPCVIVLITRDDEVLLARGNNFPPGRYSTPAGFVEIGETLEETVRREVKEEVGVDVENIRYFGSQPWPYPHQIMVGFTCTWKSGEIRIDPSEIADARWFRRDAMPHMPPPMSISRRLINSYLHAEPTGRAVAP